MPPYRICDINAMDTGTFLSIFGDVFENSPWVAAQAWEQAPFASAESFIEAMCQVAINAAPESQLGLLRAHPELGTGIKLTDASLKEQTGAEIRVGDAGKTAPLAKLNAGYRKKFGFPFIVAVKGMSLDTIIQNLRARLHNDSETEFHECLKQVCRIARYRLEEMLVKG